MEGEGECHGGEGWGGVMEGWWGQGVGAMHLLLGGVGELDKYPVGRDGERVNGNKERRKAHAQRRMHHLLPRLVDF